MVAVREDAKEETEPEAAANAAVQPQFQSAAKREHEAEAAAIRQHFLAPEVSRPATDDCARFQFEMEILHRQNNASMATMSCSYSLRSVKLACIAACGGD